MVSEGKSQVFKPLLIFEDRDGRNGGFFVYTQVPSAETSHLFIRGKVGRRECRRDTELPLGPLMEAYGKARNTLGASETYWLSYGNPDVTPEYIILHKHRLFRERY